MRGAASSAQSQVRRAAAARSRLFRQHLVSRVKLPASATAATASEGSLLSLAVSRTLGGELTKMVQRHVKQMVSKVKAHSYYLNSTAQWYDTQPGDEEDQEEDEENILEEGEEADDEQRSSKKASAPSTGHFPTRRVFYLLHKEVRSNPHLSAELKAVLQRPPCIVALHAASDLLLVELLVTARQEALCCSFATGRAEVRRRLLTSHVIGGMLGEDDMCKLWVSLGLTLTAPPSSYLPSSFSSAQHAMQQLDQARSWYYQPGAVAAMLARLQQPQQPHDPALHWGDSKYYERYHIQPVQHFGSVRGGTFARVAKDCKEFIQTRTNLWPAGLWRSQWSSEYEKVVYRNRCTYSYAAFDVIDADERH